MANKLRPKKAKAPYRKYVAGQGFVHTRGFTSQEHDLKEEESVPKSSYLDIQGPLALPWEVQALIIQMIDEIGLQHLLVCKTWYYICIPLLYEFPQLTSKNYAAFVSAVVDNKKKKLGEKVLVLDLSMILQSGKNSSISKLLRRCSPSLERFTAPQTSFGYAPLISLKACHELKYLDLGLLSETVKLKELFLAIQNFTELTHLAFPRSSVDCEGFREFKWPPNLQYLKLSGGITNEFLAETRWPRSITTLEFSSCPRVDEHGLYRVLAQIGDNLRQLYFHYPLPQLHDNSLDYVFRYCSNLISLQLMVDYCSKWAFSEHMLPPLVHPRPLRTVYLESSGSLGLAFKIHPDDFTIAIMESRLPCLKSISVSSKLNWDVKSEDVTDLVSVFEDQGGSIYLSY
ncbi:BN860_17722g1_1 [Zygosaccharomyces bailii CLIB 213]|uniref:BN860_17722g1_1 n=1 Tax=Zygosaccharomyces bailii (strain CLIB 213 / ATCC 58445 / CBS 680 / BCRC 21525 / NBRC 1098 / NCYC 1416 / NRRL Y-2227) TaxID=1333698 RepID=A0A8J2WVK9_ZYGB2|nr:BN860_17722g1_1 [Zygosaccharomyces bailii CLIB 213]